MKLNLKLVADFIRSAESEDLLDRVTIYRSGMEEAALDLMEMELDRRGFSREDIAEHGAMRSDSAILLPDGTARRCSFCERPAASKQWGWFRLYGRVPLFPCIFAYCSVHGGNT